MKDFIPYQEALELKKLAFDEPCFGRIFADEGSEQLSYSFKNSDQIGKVTSCSAPTYSQAFRFFRKKYGLFYSVERESAQEYLCNYSIKEFDGIKNIDHRGNGYRYEEDAELACLRKLIEIVKNK